MAEPKGVRKAACALVFCGAGLASLPTVSQAQTQPAPRVILPGFATAGTRAVTLVLNYTFGDLNIGQAPSRAVLAAVFPVSASWTVPDSPAGLPAPQAGDTGAPGFVELPDPVPGTTPCSNVTITADTKNRVITATGDCASGATLQAAFENVDLPLTAARYTFAATSVAAGPTSDQVLTVTVPRASRIVFTTQPSAVRVGTTMAPVTLQLEDSSGTLVTTDDQAVNIGLVRSDGSVARLAGTTRRQSAGGVVTFDDLRVPVAGKGYVLVARAADPGIEQAARSQPFDVTAAIPPALVFGTQPGGDASAGKPLSRQPVVRIVDSDGQLVTAGAAVTLAITPGTAPRDATLTCDGGTTQRASGGVATFSGCAVDRVAGGVTLTATSDVATAAVSDPFAVTPLPAPPPGPGIPWVPIAGGGVALVILIAALLGIRALRRKPPGKPAPGSISVVPRPDAGGVALHHDPQQASHHVLLVPRRGD